MLNNVILMGRITKDLELKTTPSGVSTLTFNVAVERDYTKQGEEREADFITCVAWRQTAEFISRYFSKGRMIAVTGSLRTRNYDDKNGSKHYVTEVYVDKVSFTGEPSQQGNGNQQYPVQPVPQNNAGYQQPQNGYPQQNNGGYQQPAPQQQNAQPQQSNGSYQNSTYNNNSYQQNSAQPSAPQNNAGGYQQPAPHQQPAPQQNGYFDLSDYEQILDENGTPF